VSPKEVLAHYPDFKFCIYKNSLYDITDFKHPGGQYLMHKIYGRDVSRFLTGSYHLEEYSDLPAYAHSKQAYAILERYKFGEIKDVEYSIVNKGFHGKSSSGQFETRE
jgi:cytochrome b involved in lipid metabolism